jgi:hypothetical protein
MNLKKIKGYLGGESPKSRLFLEFDIQQLTKKPSLKSDWNIEILNFAKTDYIYDPTSQTTNSYLTNKSLKKTSKFLLIKTFKLTNHKA